MKGERKTKKIRRGIPFFVWAASKKFLSETVISVWRGKLWKHETTIIEALVLVTERKCCRDSGSDQFVCIAASVTGLLFSESRLSGSY